MTYLKRAEVKSRLERERNALQSISFIRPQVPEGTEVANVLSNITSLTNPDTVRALANITDDEIKQMVLLKKQLFDLDASDTTRLARELNLKANRFTILKSHLEEIERVLSAQAVDSFNKVCESVQTKSAIAQKIRAITLSPDLLNGTGSKNWASLWEAARTFSEEDVYPDHPFPVTDKDARCVLCQQNIDVTSATHLRQLEEFVTSTVEQEFQAAQKSFEEHKKQFEVLSIRNDTINSHVEDIKIEDENLGNAIESFLVDTQERRKVIMSQLESGDDLSKTLPAFNPCSGHLEALITQLRQRAIALGSQDKAKHRGKIMTQFSTLNGRLALRENLTEVLQEIERKKRIAAYGLCLEETNTYSITVKSTAVTKKAVTEKLQDNFKNELNRINFKHVEVEIKEVGGERGILFHKLKLTRAPGYELDKIVSEGEARALSIAAFFAEISTIDNSSAIIFDDPVSSLDYKWRNNVAKRIVEEAQSRQVIVFTHDIVFLLALRQFAEEFGIKYLDQHVIQLLIGAGVCDSDLPWIALPVKKRIGVLRNKWQMADKTFREGHRKAYEKQAIMIYGLLRESWERGIEEVLLGQIVERYRPGIQTQHISIISDITEDDCKAIELGMTKSSKWLPGHDQAAGAREDVPEPAELSDDIEALNKWISVIIKRRSK